MKIGIYGGSFDPPHIEHINIAKNAIKELGLDKLVVVPARLPPHKPNSVLLDGNRRKEMLEIAFSKEILEGKIEISDFELSSQERSYTYLTIERFKSVYKDAELFFLVGTDMLEDFPTWKNPLSILESAKLFVTSREGEDLEKAKTLFNQSFIGFNDSLIFARYVGKKISSTDVRNRLLLGLSVEGKLDAGVIKYIEDCGIYKGDAKAAFVRKSLPISRLTHTLGVMNLAKTYAKRLKIDENKAVLAAMLHDVAKYLDPNDYEKFTMPCGVPKSVVHQFLGAYIAENVLGVTDRDVINAVKYHTTGRKNMSVLEKIVFIADLLEEGRTYDEAPLLRKAVDNDFFEGFKLCLKRLQHFLSSIGDEEYYLTKECYDYYIE